MVDTAVEALRASCRRSVGGHGVLTAADLLALIPQDTAMDVYGSGGVVEELEGEVAALLGKPAAIFLPSGTMAQQAVLRVHADRRGPRTVLFHPTCHLDEHEGRGYERLHDLVGRPVGDRQRLITLADLESVAEPFAVLLIELPQREIGGSQPVWDELVAQTGWARSRGAAVHLDGARLWESAAGYGVPPAEVADLFDTAYVSFYKGLGGITGCCVVGEPDVVAELREWRQRHGGTLYALWPYAAAALTALRQRLPLMARYLEHARDIATLLREVPGVTVRPDPPQVPMMHLLLRASAGTLTSNIRRVAEQQGIWTWPAPMATTDRGSRPSSCRSGTQPSSSAQTRCATSSRRCWRTSRHDVVHPVPLPRQCRPTPACRLLAGSSRLAWDARGARRGRARAAGPAVRRTASRPT